MRTTTIFQSRLAHARGVAVRARPRTPCAGPPGRERVASKSNAELRARLDTMNARLVRRPVR